MIILTSRAIPKGAETGARLTRKDGQTMSNLSDFKIPDELTAVFLDKLSDDECRYILHSKAIDYYGTDRYKSKLAAEVGMSLDGLNNWYRRGGRPSTAVIMYLSAQLELRKANETLSSLARGLKGLRGYLPD